MTMRRLEIGDVVATNYGTGAYRIVEIERGCTCPDYLDEIEMDDPPGSLPHLHIVAIYLAGPRKGRQAYLNGYEEGTGKNVWRPEDRLMLVEGHGPVQTTMF